MKIAVAGAGYVGLSIAVLLSMKNDVVAYDIDKTKTDKINKRETPFHDKTLEEFFLNNSLDLTATTNAETAFKNAKYVIISTSVGHDPLTGSLDTGSVESVISEVLRINKNALMIIRSTVPVGYTRHVRKKFNTDNILFSPELLREGNALFDSLYPSRIIVGEKSKRAKAFADVLIEAAYKPDIPLLFTDPEEAESIKLFANAYLAMRISFFNEIDTFSEFRNLDTKQIIDGICLDPRIGMGYNNPSFGYGGYCLPKDTRQLLKEYADIPQSIITSVVDANIKRKKCIADMIIAKNPDSVGIYRLNMKKDSDNSRDSAVLYIMEKLYLNGIEVLVYEPFVSNDLAKRYKVIDNIDEFKNMSNIILANRMSDEISDVASKVYTRDIFGRD